MCRVIVVDSNGVVVGSEPAPQRYCSEEEQRRIRQQKAMENFFYEEGYRDAEEGNADSSHLVFCVHGIDAAESYCRGYNEAKEDDGYCAICGEYHTHG